MTSLIRAVCASEGANSFMLLVAFSLYCAANSFVCCTPSLCDHKQIQTALYRREKMKNHWKSKQACNVSSMCAQYNVYYPVNICQRSRISVNSMYTFVFLFSFHPECPVLCLMYSQTSLECAPVNVIFFTQNTVNNCVGQYGHNQCMFPSSS